MQRKSRFLKEREGFAMITAIFFMVIMATLLLSMLGSSSETAERTTKTYVNEQAQLLAKSATEYAILRVSGVNRGATNANCLPGFTAVYPTAADPMYDITVTINYFGFDNGCAPLFPAGTVGTIQTAESLGTMLIDVYVQDNPNLGLDEPVRYHRRTLQKL
jgi:hypothetical protein